MFDLSDNDVLYLLLCPAIALSFCLVSAAFMYVDLTGKPEIISKHRLQPKERPTYKDYATLWPVVIKQNGFITVVLGSPFTLWLFRRWEIQAAWPAGYAMPAGQLVQALVEFTLMTLVYDLWFFACHRAFHHPKLYRFHKGHHEWKAPCAFEGAYFDAFDFIVGNLGPLLFLPPLVTSSYYLILAFGCTGVGQVAICHCGYDTRGALWFLGCMKPSIRHDAHHEFFNVNFSTFGAWDVVFGTYLDDEGVIERRNKLKKAMASSD